jgi:hypothetical protein
MKKITGIIFLFFLVNAFAKTNNSGFVIKNMFVDTIPVALPANFTDDYGIKYSISDTLWYQLPSAKYHIIRWNLKEQYVIAKNGLGNPSDGGLYTRIDYMQFKNMEPFLWGFCLSNFNAQSDSLAEFSPTKTDRLNPRKGCNGYPFSRMKKIE